MAGEGEAEGEGDPGVPRAAAARGAGACGGGAGEEALRAAEALRAGRWRRAGRAGSPGEGPGEVSAAQGAPSRPPGVRLMAWFLPLSAVSLTDALVDG